MLALGAPCPPEILEEFEIPRTQLPALAGEPTLLGLAESWDVPADLARQPLAVELERLGVALLLVSSRELIAVRPKDWGDAIVRASRVRLLWPSGLGPWHRAPAVNAALGPRCVSTRRATLTLALIDEHGIVRWLQRSQQQPETLELISATLERARRNLLEGQRRASGDRSPAARTVSRAALTESLLSAFTRTFGDGEAAPATLRDSAPLRDSARDSAPLHGVAAGTAGLGAGRTLREARPFR